MSKLKLDLHPIYNKGDQIDKALNNSINEAAEKRIDELEIICGKGSGQLKKRVLRFLDKKETRAKYHRLKKTPKTGAEFCLF